MLLNVVCFVFLFWTSTAWSAPTVTVLNGTYEGVSLDSFGEDLFLGMPFAQQPVGDLRLRAPLSLNTSWEDVNQATNYSAICPGFPTNTNDDAGYPLSEACLTINVIRPSTVTEGANVPVVIWIFGGGFSMGGSSDIRHNCSWFVQRSMEMAMPIVFVNFNYRVHAFGFLGGSEVHAAGVENLGLLDQRLAFQWVQENIAAFGGDPTLVTIMGESAGAMSVANHLTAYGGRNDNLFRAAIMESGSPTTENYQTIAQLQPMYNNITLKTGCANATDTLECLRGVPYDSFYAAANGTTWQPVIDGVYIPEYPSEMLAAGQYIRVPLLIGTNTDEGQLFGAYGVNSTEALESWLHTSYPMLTNDSIAQFIQLYPNDPGLGCPYGTGDGLLPSGYLDKVALSIGGDIVMIAARRLLAQIASQTQPVYSYRFNQVPVNYTMEVGVTHYVEVAYVYSNPLQTAFPLGNRPRDLALANLMTSMWVSMIHDLNPNNNKVPGAPYWPEYSTGPQNLVLQYLGTGQQSYIEEDTWRSEGIAFINSLGPQLEH